MWVKKIINETCNDDNVIFAESIQQKKIPKCTLARKSKVESNKEQVKKG